MAKIPEGILALHIRAGLEQTHHEILASHFKFESGRMRTLILNQEQKSALALLN